MSVPKPLVVIVERDEALEKLNILALEVAGYQVETLPGVDVRTFVEQTRPQVIVLGIHSATPQDRNLLTQLQANPNTRDIPVVVVASDKYLIALAKAVPVTSATVVSPYQVEELEAAVARAIQNPPPAAVLPSAVRPPSPALLLATEELARNAHQIVIETIREIREDEPYRSRFVALLPDFVDNLGKMLGAINQGLRRNLSPADVFSVPAIQRSIEEHSQLRKREGIDAAAAIREYQVLALHLSQFLVRLVEQGHLTIHEFLQVRDQAQQYVDELVRLTVRLFDANDQANHSP